MPRIKDLERFKRDLVALARENEVLGQWGEVREDPPLPTEESQPSTPPPAPKIPRPSRSPDTAPDFASLLSDLPLGEPAAGALSEEPSSDAELDALLSFPEEETAPDLMAETPIESLAEADSEVDSEVEAEVKAEAEEDFSSGFDLGAIADSMEETSLDEMAEEAATADETLPEMSFDIPGEAGPTETPEADDFALPEASDFDLGDFEPGATEASPSDETALEEELEEAPAAEEPEEVASEPIEESIEAADFDFGDASFLTDDTGLAAEAAPEPGAADESSALPDLGGDDFSIPDFNAPAPSAKAGAGKEASFGTSSAAAETAAAPDDLAGFSMDEADFGAAPGEPDAFESFTFDEPAPAGLAGEALDRELANLGDDSDLAPTFSLEESSWNNFGAPEREEAAAGAPSARPAAAKRKEPPARAVALTEAQVDRLQDRLLALPLNLRVAVEDIVANEKGNEAQRSDLVWMLVENATAEQIAGAAGKVLKRRIAIPEGYVHGTGAGYLAEKGSLGYVFTHTILPILRTSLLILLVAGALGYLGYRFVYRPLAATSLYRTGYERIAQGRYPEAEDAFARATEIREYIIWYYRYAEAYVAKRHYIYAENKYKALLDRHPDEREGALDWARLERDQLKYEEARQLINKRLLDRDPLDKDALLLLGDIFLEWSDEDPSKFEAARKSYALLIQSYGTKDLYLERMLLYFMRVDKLSEVLPLKDRFLAMKKPPLSASTLAELGGYLLDRKQMPDLLHVLELALKSDPTLPETHWQLFHYYRAAGKPAEELKGLDNSIAGFEALPALGKRRLSMYLEALLRRGDVRLAGQDYLTAEEDYGKAAVAYENALELDRLQKSPTWGRAWAGLGDVAYWGKDDLSAAEGFYAKAEGHGFDDGGMRYRRGFIASRAGRYADALEHFWRSMQAGSESPALIYALGNTFFERQDYHAAEGYYRRLVESLGDKLASLDYPQPQEKTAEQDLVSLLMEAQNNRGVALYRLANRTGNAKLKAEAIAAFDESARLYDLMVQDSRSLITANNANLGYLNMDYVLHPRRGIDLATYRPISKDDSWNFTKHPYGYISANSVTPVEAPPAAAEGHGGE